MSWLDTIDNNIAGITMPEEREPEGGEKEWLLEKLGKVSPSRFGKLVKTGKDGKYFLSKSQTADTLIYKIAWERLLNQHGATDGMERLLFSSKPTQHGEQNEGAGILKYEQVTGRKVERNVFKFIEIDDYMGGTPDGFVGDDGLIEVKCPYDGGNHLRTLLTGEIYNQEHVYQVQGYMMITGRKWCDYVTYDPDLPDGIDIAVIRVERNEEIIEGIRAVIAQVIKKLKELKAKLNDKH